MYKLYKQYNTGRLACVGTVTDEAINRLGGMLALNKLRYWVSYT